MFDETYGFESVVATESFDGDGAADHDEPYTYHQPNSRSTFPFSARQYAHLLVLRSRIQDGGYWLDTPAAMNVRLAEVF